LKANELTKLIAPLPGNVCPIWPGTVEQLLSATMSSELDAAEQLRLFKQIANGDADALSHGPFV
jgi:hypothetical protein